ncbi:hypothetical protein HMPREF0262_03615 [Clostridium sp. ATCC 29733]|nr:hypothetical protein HMPREF0262_03615 [Clostridium sp. ATCC 29733]
MKARCHCAGGAVLPQNGRTNKGTGATFTSRACLFVACPYMLEMPNGNGG